MVLSLVTLIHPGYLIQSSCSYGGTITPSTYAAYHGSATFTISPNSGFAVGGVIVDGAYVGKISSYTFTNVASTHTISAAFQDQTGTLYSIMQITDTQHLSSTYPTLYTNTTNWIVNNTGTFNVRMVVHTGDIVDGCNDTSQWTNANTAMSVLLNNNVPYSWDAGNHDQFGCWAGGPNRGWIGLNYAAFNATTMESKSYWVDDRFQGKNTAVKFTYGGYNFLIINMEYHANSTVIDWMTNLIKSYPSYNVVVATHFYIGINGGYDAWSTNLKTTLNSYPNVFLTMSGHDISGTDILSSAVKQMVGTREETMFNLQEIDSEHGAATVRLFTFNTTSNTVIVSTYQVYTNTWSTSAIYSYRFSAYLHHAITFALDGVSNDYLITTAVVLITAAIVIGASYVIITHRGRAKGKRP
jgi:hypothetical protein